MKFDKRIFFKDLFERLKNNLVPKVDLHVHTNWTDGENSISEMYQEAENKSLEAIFFSEHSRKESGKWFFDFCKEIDELPLKSCLPIVGTEVKVLNLDGDLDFNNEYKNVCDLIMASVHRFPGEKTNNIWKSKSNLNPEEIIKLEFNLMCASLKNPLTDILGHPFGMSIKRFGIDPPEELFDEIIMLCKKYNKIFEVNSRYHKSPKDLINKCINSNTLISIGSNAHSKNELGNILEEIK
jgi:histidinol phosphatase-like PHP family hydrolase|tara:strand:+ start:395 stop:1111 length:717 start_codon:yes stop_codon:yes gene_type:complete